MTVLASMYTLLSQTTAVTDVIASYHGSPAIFAGVSIPEDCENQAVSIKIDGASSPISTDRKSRGGEVPVDVIVWGDNILEDDPLLSTAMIIWRTLDRASLESEAGYEMPKCVARLPTPLRDRNGYPGYSIQCFVLVREI